MTEDDRYAQQLALSQHDDWQFSRIFAGENARPGFTALLALRAEMQNVLAQASEPGIAAVKFEWWRNEIEQGFEGRAQHPLARVLGEHLGKAGSAPEYCHELVDAAEAELGSAAPFGDADFPLYLYRSGGVLAEQLAMLSGCRDRDVVNAARKLGQLKRFNDLVWFTGAMLRAGRWLFPAEWLERHELTVTTVLGNEKGDQVRALRDEMLSMLDRERITARTAMQDVSLPPALALQWSLAQKDHARLREQPGRMFEPAPESRRGLGRLWTAWRAVRRAARSDSKPKRLGAD